MIPIEKVVVQPRARVIEAGWTIEYEEIEYEPCDPELEEELTRILYANVFRSVRKGNNKRKKQKRAYCK